MEAYIVQPGDTLGKIAARFLGDSQRYQEIVDANPQITNPNLIQVGSSIIIPSSQQGQLSKSSGFPALIPSAAASTLKPDQLPKSQFMVKLTELMQNKKLLIGIGAGILAIFYFTSKKRKK